MKLRRNNHTPSSPASFVEQTQASTAQRKRALTQRALAAYLDQRIAIEESTVQRIYERERRFACREQVPLGLLVGSHAKETQARLQILHEIRALLPPLQLKP